MTGDPLGKVPWLQLTVTLGPEALTAGVAPAGIVTALPYACVFAVYDQTASATPIPAQSTMPVIGAIKTRRVRLMVSSPSPRT